MNNNYEIFKKELTQLMNRYNIDTITNIPDFVLADYLHNCIVNLATATQIRDNWLKIEKEDA